MSRPLAVIGRILRAIRLCLHGYWLAAYVLARVRSRRGRSPIALAGVGCAAINAVWSKLAQHAVISLGGWACGRRRLIVMGTLLAANALLKLPALYCASTLVNHLAFFLSEGATDASFFAAAFDIGHGVLIVTRGQVSSARVAIWRLALALHANPCSRARSDLDAPKKPVGRYAGRG